MKTATIRPGLLVGLNTAIRGGVEYQKLMIEDDHIDDGGAAVAKWETTRVIADPVEHERAIKARGKARALIAGACARSVFGLLCPVDREPALDAAIADAQRIAADFNASASTMYIDVNVIAGRIAADDVQAAKAIGSEVRDLLDAMQNGITAAQPDAIREAASRARTVSAMLDDTTQKKVSAAIAEVRKLTREIVRVQKAGEQAATIIDAAKLDALAGARFAVLDMIGETESPEPGADVAPIAGRAIDMDAAPVAEMSASPAPSFEF